jgi:hypothetical protein
MEKKAFKEKRVIVESRLSQGATEQSGFLTAMPSGTSPEVLTFNMSEPADLSWTYPEGRASIRSLKGRFPTEFFLGIAVRNSI